MSDKYRKKAMNNREYSRVYEIKLGLGTFDVSGALLVIQFFSWLVDTWRTILWFFKKNMSTVYLGSFYVKHIYINKRVIY